MRGRGRGPGAGPGPGRGQGRRKGMGNKRRMLGFLQPCILIQLCEADKHGYDLLQGLEKYMHDGADYDPSMIYRLMREMETNGYVDSYEGEVSRGPRRKMYRLTADGEAQLKSWVDDLERSKQEIEMLLSAYKKIS